MSWSEHLVGQRAEGRIGAPRSMRELPQLHRDGEEGRERPSDQAGQSPRGIAGRRRRARLALVHLAFPRRRRGARPARQRRAHGKYRRGRRERDHVRLDAEGRYGRDKPTATGEHHDNGAPDGRPKRRAGERRVHLLGPSPTAQTAPSWAVEPLRPVGDALRSEGISPRSSGAVATAHDARHAGGPAVMVSPASLPGRDWAGRARPGNPGGLDREVGEVASSCQRSPSRPDHRLRGRNQ